MVITLIRGLITPFITSHEPPSEVPHSSCGRRAEVDPRVTSGSRPELCSTRSLKQKARAVESSIWVVVKIRVPFWVP